MAKPTFASVTDVSCSCGYLQECADDAGLPIKFDRVTNEFHFEFDRPGQAKGTLILYHCPFCGGTAPDSQRDKLFAVIPQEEEDRLFDLMREVRTVQDAMRVLGRPNFDHPQGSGSRQPERDGEPPVSERLRTLIYTELSAVAEVRLTVYPNDNVHISLQGKYVGASKAGA